MYICIYVYIWFARRRSDFIGMIDNKVSPSCVVNRAIEDATFMCERKYGEAPEVILIQNQGSTFSYVPAHIHYIMLELLKNAMRATVEVSERSEQAL